MPPAWHKAGASVVGRAFYSLLFVSLLTKTKENAPHWLKSVFFSGLSYTKPREMSLGWNEMLR